MGLYACYHAVTPTKLEELLESDSETVFEELEEIAEEGEENYTDLDKLWDGLHFLLTGHDSNDLNEDKSPQNVALHQLFFGQELLIENESDADVYYIPAEDVPNLNAVLAKLNFSDFSQNVDFNKFVEKDIYANIWHGEDESYDELLEELEEYFDKLQDFYQYATDNQLAVITFVG